MSGFVPCHIYIYMYIYMYQFDGLRLPQVMFYFLLPNEQ